MQREIKPRFSKLSNILSCSETRDIYYLWRPFLRDNDDEMVLDLAVASNADYIVTFNIGDFVNLELFGIEVIEPAGFLELIKEK
ncbi:MAG: PIN domain-containing protein [Pyrinomonadaceae bacterium]